jgi:predicted regulator of Ras-like GTPase activity (Roadblock/LC7/MglB family)
MFDESLEKIVKDVQGARAAVVMGFDGILVDMFGESEDMDVESMGMEFSVLLKEVRKAAELLDAGSADEMTIRTDKLLAVLRAVNDDYFVAMALSPGGNIGKARYMLRVTVPLLHNELS